MSVRSSGWKLFRRVANEQREYFPHIACLLLLNLTAAPLALLNPLALKIAVDSFIGDSPLPDFFAAMVPESANQSTAALVIAVLLTLLVALPAHGQKLASELLRTWTSGNIALKLRTRIFPHVERLPLSFHDEKGTSDSTYRILYDTGIVPVVLIDGVVPLVTAIATLVAMSWIIVALSPPLALIAIIIAPVLFLISRPFGRRLRDQWHEAKQLESKTLSLLQEVLSAVRVVKAFGKEEREKERLVTVATSGMLAQYRVVATKGRFDAAVGFVTAVGSAAVLYVGMGEVAAGVLTLGELLMVIAYLTHLYGPIEVVIGQIATLQSSLASAERALELLDEVPEALERPHARPLDRAVGSVEFRNVSFSYDSKSQVLRNVSFWVPPTTRLGIVGATGAGKTTLVNLMTRLYDPTHGEIALDGVDLRDYRLADLRNQFAIVLQEPVLFSKTIAENIAYARPGASRDEIVEAAVQAGANDFINGLPRGYETTVGERGMRLSGGERQRISLARAFLKDAPILILDEPTSSVDMRTEDTILAAMSRLMKDRTTFIIAHRPSTLRNCDKVLVIDKGRLVESASPSSDAEIESLLRRESAEVELS